MAGELRATGPQRAHAPLEKITLTCPLSSSRLTKTAPFAVSGCWRCVTTPATRTLALSAPIRRAAIVTPRSSSHDRTRAMAVASGVRPIAHRSSATRSNSVVIGRRGARNPVTTPSSRSVVLWAAAPAVQVRARRLSPKQSIAPAAASASRWCC